MLRTEKGRRVVAAVPHDRTLTESDGPYARARGHAAAPKDMRQLVSELAKQWCTPPEEVRERLYHNMASLYVATVGSARSGCAQLDITDRGERP